MEFSDIPNPHRHHQSRHGRHQGRHREHREAHPARALGSDQRGSLTRWPTREEYAHVGNKQSLVDTWLEDIEIPRLQAVHKNESLPKEPSPKARARPRSTYRLRSPSPRRAVAHNRHNEPASKASPPQSRRERIRLRHLVPDSAVLSPYDEHDNVQVQPEVSRILRPVSAATESNYERGKKRPHMGSEDSVESVVSAAQYHFEKKARHKTRTDRYDTTRVREPRKAGKKKRKKTVDQTKVNGTRRGGDFSSAREVMDNFNSKSILSDRITMRPTVRPGLFDNGRASKNQLPDLTFHEMHFLKRTPPSKPAPRGRERAKRRGERKLEEVSAFFLHKGMPEASSVPSRDQPINGAPSLDRATRDSSASSIDIPPHPSRPDEEYGHKSSHVDRESSRGAATNWTWSSSYVPLERGIAQANVTRKHVSAQSSTPSRSRNALERTGIFQNTGIRCFEGPKEVASATPRSDNNSSNREPLAMVSNDIVNRESDSSRQKVRIVRYHDRGVMASEEAENTTGCRLKATGTRQDAVEQSTGNIRAKITASANGVSCSRFAPGDETVSHPQGEEDMYIAAASHAGDHDPGPDRPRSPKCEVVERLEAAAENVTSRELQNDLAIGTTPLPVQEDLHSASGRQNHSIPDAHDASRYRRLATESGFVGDRQLDLLDTTQETNRLNAITDGRLDRQQPHEVNMTPRFASKPMTDNPHQFSNIEQPPFDVQIVSSARRQPSQAHSMAHYTLEGSSNVRGIPLNSGTTSHTVMNDWPAAGHGQLGSNHFFSEAQSVLPEAAELSPQMSSRHQILEEYIAQMENDVLCRPQEDDVDGDSPMPSWHGLQDNDAVCLERAPQAHRTYFGAYNRDLSEDGPLGNRSIGRSHHGGGRVMHDSDVDQEEQRFMSTFWRPKCY